MTTDSVLLATNPGKIVPLKQIWSGRCPVPTASGIALKLGWLAEEFARDAIAVSDTHDRPQQSRGSANTPHALHGLLREGGNIPVLAARAQGEPSRLIGLTWIDEGQAIIVRPGSGITEPKHLKGKRVALPAFGQDANGRRGSSIARGMTLHGIKGALSLAGLTFDDIKFLEVGSGDTASSEFGLQGLWAGLDHLADGKVDAVYVKGSSAADAVKRLGLTVGIDIDHFPDRRFRINNGTPRPLTVHAELLEEHFDVVVRFLYQSLRAAEWAKTNLNRVLEIYQSETRGSAEGVAAAYRDGFHLSLHPNLSDERLGYFRTQKDFLFLHGFLDRDFDLDAWVDFRPLEAAQKLLAERGSV
ncbi:MAG: ABC transporter substrate-binding protein [Nitrosomonadales bacterium]